MCTIPSSDFLPTPSSSSQESLNSGAAISYWSDHLYANTILHLHRSLSDMRNCPSNSDDPVVPKPSPILAHHYETPHYPDKRSASTMCTPPQVPATRPSKKFDAMQYDMDVGPIPQTVMAEWTLHEQESLVSRALTCASVPGVQPRLQAFLHTYTLLLVAEMNYLFTLFDLSTSPFSIWKRYKSWKAKKNYLRRKDQHSKTMHSLSALVALSLLSSPATALVAYDCSTLTTNYTILNAAYVGECVARNHTVNETKVEIQLIQLTKVAPVMVYQCKVSVTRSAFYCGMHSHLSLVAGSLASYIAELGLTRCRDAHVTRSLYLQPGVTINDLKINATTTVTATLAGQSDQSANCRGANYFDSYGSYYNVVVPASIEVTLTSHLAVRSLQDDKIHFRSGATCAYSEQYCMDFYEGESYWSMETDDACQSAQHTVLYQGIATETQYLSYNGVPKVNVLIDTQDKLILVEKKRRAKLCHLDIYYTEHSSLLIAYRNDIQWTLQQKPLYPQIVDEMLYVNSKLIYLEHGIAQNLNQLYNHLDYQQCLSHRQTLQNLLSLAVIDPVEFAYSYMKQPGYTALLMGEAVYLFRCQPVDVRLRQTENCYIELPVNHTGRAVFMTPRTRLLRERGEQTNCNPLTKPLYMLDGMWYALSPNTHEARAPETLSPAYAPSWSYVAPAMLAERGIYTMTELESFRNQMLFQGERTAVSNIISRGATGMPTDLSGITLTNLFSEEEVEKIGVKFSQKLWGWFSTFGNISSGIIGILIFFRICKFMLDTVIHMKALHELYGFSIHLLAGIWDSLTTYLLSHQGAHMHNEDAKETEVELVPVEKHQTAGFAPVLDSDKGECPTASVTIYPKLPIPIHRGEGFNSHFPG